VDQEKQPKQPGESVTPGDEHLAHDPAVDDFLMRLTHNMRHAKPGQEAVAAALQAIQRLALEVDSEQPSRDSAASPQTCTSCGARNRSENRFCSSCGVPLPAEVSEPHLDSANSSRAQAEQQTDAMPPGDHHYYHHYHHHIFGEGTPGTSESESRAASASPARVRAPLSGPALSRAESGVRKMTQDWAYACNTKHLDDLVSLYVNDAIVLRPNIPAVRGTAAIREMFFSVLESGFGEVEVEAVRVEVFGEMAYEAGRCKALVPVAMGKRREERGMYLILCTRQNGEWKIIADCWSSDLSLSDSSVSGKTLRKS
jgi:ketosteroid isomerase-like protein